MLLDDSLEFEVIPPSNDAELVPMIKWGDIQLSNIWIPSALLLNRQGVSQTFSDRHESVIHRTLGEQKVVSSLSVYPGTEIAESRFSSSEKLLDSLEELPSKHLKTKSVHLQQFNEEVVRHSCLELPSNYPNASKSEPEGSKDLSLEEICDSPDSSIVDYLEHLNISDDEGDIGIIEEPNNHEIPISVQGYSVDAELLGACNDKISSELVCDMPEKTDTLSLICEVDQDSEILATVSHSNNHEILLSAQGYSREAVLLETYNDKISTEFACDTPTKIDTYSLNNEIDQDSEIPATVSSFSNSDQSVDIIELSEKIWNASRINCEKSLDNLSETVNCPEETIGAQYCPFLLPKSKDEDLSPFVTNNGKNNKKEKRSKKKAAKNIPLDNFFLNKAEAAVSDTPYLDFCESLRHKYGYPSTFEKSESNSSSVFPSITELNTTEESEHREKYSSNLTTNLTLDSLSSSDYNIDPSSELDSCLTKYVIENIPPFVDEEMLQSLILQYGDIKNVAIRQIGKTLKAMIVMNLEDPNWIIECLNGSYPFGASSGEGLKCYQIL